MKKSETLVVAAIMAWVMSNGGDCWHVHGSSMQRSGEPDLDGAIFVKGVPVHFKIEIKVDGNTTTPLQEFRLARWRSYGYVTGVAHNLDEFKELIGW